MAVDRETLRRLSEAEEKIQKILLDLEEETGKRVDYVDVDARNFGNLRTEIFLAEGHRL